MPTWLQGPLAVLGRICLSTVFLMSAIGNKIPKFNEVAGFMAQAGVPAPRPMLVGAIIFLTAGSLSVILGYKARLGALLLAIFLVLATYFFHAFWKETEEAAQVEQMIQFMKNLSMFGAMLLIMATGSGPMSLDRLVAKRHDKPELPEAS